MYTLATNGPAKCYITISLNSGLSVMDFICIFSLFSQ